MAALLCVRVLLTQHGAVPGLGLVIPLLSSYGSVVSAALLTGAERKERAPFRGHVWHAMLFTAFLGVCSLTMVSKQIWPL